MIVINPSGRTRTDPDGPDGPGRTRTDGRTDGRMDGADGADRYLHQIQNRGSDLGFAPNSLSEQLLGAVDDCSGSSDPNLTAVTGVGFETPTCAPGAGKPKAMSLETPAPHYYQSKGPPPTTHSDLPNHDPTTSKPIKSLKTCYHPSGGPSAPGRRFFGERGAPLRCAPTPHSLPPTPRQKL